MDKSRDPGDAGRFMYRLPERGIDPAAVLMQPVLWSAHHAKTDAPQRVVRAMRTDPDDVLAQVRASWRSPVCKRR